MQSENPFWPFWRRQTFHSVFFFFSDKYCGTKAACLRMFKRPSESISEDPDPHSSSFWRTLWSPFFRHWKQFLWTAGSWRLSGNTPFSSRPGQNAVLASLSLFRDPSHKKLLEVEVLSLLKMGAIEVVPEPYWRKGFYSCYFLSLHPFQKGDQDWWDQVCFQFWKGTDNSIVSSGPIHKLFNNQFKGLVDENRFIQFTM